MPSIAKTSASTAEADQAIVDRIRQGELDQFARLMRLYNRRLFRVTRAILRNDAEAEEVVQEAWLRAFVNLDGFEARSSLATWLTRIAIHEAIRRAGRREREAELRGMETPSPASSDPESEIARAEIRRMLELAIDRLPASSRIAVILRDVEELSTSDAAECLGISESAMKVRLHRARALLRREIAARFGETAAEIYGFGGTRCDRVVENVLLRIRALAQ